MFRQCKDFHTNSNRKCKQTGSYSNSLNDMLIARNMKNNQQLSLDIDNPNHTNILKANIDVIHVDK